MVLKVHAGAIIRNVIEEQVLRALPWAMPCPVTDTASHLLWCGSFAAVKGN
jgi:hypothetical protein